MQAESENIKRHLNDLETRLKEYEGSKKHQSKINTNESEFNSLRSELKNEIINDVKNSLKIFKEELKNELIRELREISKETFAYQNGQLQKMLEENNITLTTEMNKFKMEVRQTNNMEFKENIMKNEIIQKIETRVNNVSKNQHFELDDIHQKIREEQDKSRRAENVIIFDLLLLILHLFAAISSSVLAFVGFNILLFVLP